jgi:hypothetical protein
MAIFTYAVKFLCGEFDRKLVGEHSRLEGPVKPGNYLTAINIHNPNGRTVPLEKRGILLFAGAEPTPQERFEQPLKPAPSIKAELPADWGMEIDCPDIRMQLLRGAAPPAPTFIKGWVIISSPAPLNVVAVYTSHAFGRDGLTEGFALEVDRVPPSQATLFGARRPTVKATRTPARRK